MKMKKKRCWSRDEPEVEIGDTRGSNDMDWLIGLNREGNRVSQGQRGRDVSRHSPTEVKIGNC